ncbi:MAG: deoxyguanosinetriphosphate triphosphohydrolase [Anaerovoracaceae bacterium]
MVTREDIEKKEHMFLGQYAQKADTSKGREKQEEKCIIRTDFMRDRDRIIHSKAFRRLMHKTQVFIAPEKDHYRTRLTHTIEVGQIARTIGRALSLNEDLIEAIALGHDLGHTPFGHTGEETLDYIHPGGFSHHIQSLRVVDVLEGEKGPGGRGLNLTYEVRDGILNHTGNITPFTLEGQTVKLSDRIAYINHDIDDAIQGGILEGGEIPRECSSYLGNDHRQRVNTMVLDTVENSYDRPAVAMSRECGYYMDLLREFMFKRVYLNPGVKRKEVLEEADKVIISLYSYYITHLWELPENLLALSEESGPNEVVKDYIAGMTDGYAKRLYEEKFK